MLEIHDWDEIENGDWGTLLLGNGMSINVSSDFDYSSLYEKAREVGVLDDSVKKIFEVCGTKNFEVALSKLRDAIAIDKALKEEKEDEEREEEELNPYMECFRNIQDTLGLAVREVHLYKEDVPPQTLDAIHGALQSYRTIFTTSYDLLAYWAIARHRYRGFCDCFWGPHNTFDPANCSVRGGYRPIYYLHGALHLVVGGDGATWKLTQNDLEAGDVDILDRFDKEMPGDPEARSLLVTEGSARDKLQAIEGNDYLSHVYRTLKQAKGDLVVFGHSLGEHDRHLIDAINANPKRSVAVSMHGRSKKKLHETGHQIVSKLHVENVLLFDAKTHPLGDPELEAPDA